MAVSLLQSLTSVRLGRGGRRHRHRAEQRAAGFAVQGDVIAGTRPYHTLIPGMLTRERRAASGRSA